MLLPSGPYESVLHDLVESLEADAGGGRLSSEQSALYEIARALADAFKASARSNETSWRRLETRFNDVPRGEPRISCRVPICGEFVWPEQSHLAALRLA